MKPTARQRSLPALLVATLLSAWTYAAPAAAQPSVLELKVKTAFIYNFARYFTWPAGKLPQPDTPIDICVLEPDPFGDILTSSLAGKTVDSHPLKLRTVARVEDLRSCHIAYLPGTDSKALEAAFTQLSGAGVVTVHEANRPISGGVVRFFADGRRVRFEINTLAAAKENLELSLKLQSLAVTVRK